ncbi:MAG: hypothetical protein ACF8XB_21530 [Planctomycetota bacterium JB042]
MVQSLIPDRTLVYTNWTNEAGIPVRIFQAVDEGVDTHDGDTTYGYNTAGTNALTLRLSDATDPESSSNHVIRMRARRVGTASLPETKLQVVLKDGASTIASFEASLTGTYDEISYTLSGAEADAITDYDDLTLEIEAAGGSSTIRITAIQLDIPDAPSSGGETVMRATTERIEVASKVEQTPSLTPLALPSVLPNLLLNNWAEVGVVCRSSYLTDVSPGVDGDSEERQGLRSRPAREVSFRTTAMTQEAGAKAHLNLARMTAHRTPGPLLCDITRVSVASSGTTVTCPTSHRRFFVGGRVAVAEVRDGEPFNIQYGTIETVNPGSLVLSDALSGSYPKGSIVVPLIDSEISLTGGFRARTDRRGFEAQITLEEPAGAHALPPTHGLSPDATGQTYRGLPVVRPEPNWVRPVGASIVRDGSRVDLGRASIVFPRGSRPKFAYSYSAEMDREEWWNLLQLWDSRRASAYPFFLISPLTLFVPVEVATDRVDVPATGNLEDLQDFLEFVVLETDENEPIIREVESFTDQGDRYRIVFDEPIPPLSVPDIKRLTSAHHSRFVQDTLEESWITDNRVRVDLDTIEVVGRDPVVLENIDQPLVFGDAINVPDLLLWVDVSRNVWEAEVSPAHVRTAKCDPTNPSEQNAFIIDDARVDGDRLFTEGLNFPRPYLVIDTANDRGTLLHFDEWKTNHGLPTLERSEQYQLISDVDPWDNSKGMTLIYCGRLPRPHPSPGLNDHDVFTKGGLDTGNALSFFWSTTGVWISVTGTKLPSSADQILSYSSITKKKLGIYVLTWSPGNYVRVYRNGVLRGEQLSGVPSTIAATGAKALMFGAFNSGSTLSGKEDELTKHVFSNSALIYRRALDTVELNAIGEFLAAQYPTQWQAIP